MADKKQKKQVEDAISARLKDYYHSVESEPIPEQFLDLLEKLDEAEEKSKQGTTRLDGGSK